MEVVYKYSEFKFVEKLEFEKLVVCVSFLKWMREKIVRCFFCKCLVSEDEFIYYLFMYGLGCLFCSCIFYDIKGFLEYSRIMYLGKKKLFVDYSNKGF